MALDALSLVLLAALVLNVWASLAVFRDRLSSRGQRVAQLAIVWLLPILGSLLALHMNRSKPESSTGDYPPVPNAGEDFGASQPSHRRAIETFESAAASQASSDGNSGD